MASRSDRRARLSTYATAMLLVISVLSVLGLQTAQVQGAQTRLLEETFGPDGTPATRFERPAGLALDQSTGNVYVGDAFPSETVQNFSLTHQPELFTGISSNVVAGQLSGFHILLPGQLAVDSTSHHILVVAGSESVRAYQANGEPADFSAGPGTGTNELLGSEVCGVTVDANGDIYESEFTGGVRVYASSGALITTAPVSDPCNLAVSSTGTLYANTLGSPEAGSSGPVQKLSPSEFPLISSTTYTVEEVDSNATFTVGIDPGSDALLADEGNQVAEYNSSGVRLGAFGSDVIAGESGWGSGLAVNGATQQAYVDQGNFQGQVEIFGEPLLLPDISTGTADEITPKGQATLHGTVNPDGIAVTGCRFDYGPTESYGKTAACEQTVGSGTGEVAVTAKLTSLEPGVTYHYRLQASNAQAETKEVSSNGADATFATPPQPTIDFMGIADLNATSIQLQASVNPESLKTSCTFEYGTTPSYGTSLACEPPTIEGSNDVLLVQHIEGLSPDVTYHWRVVASSEAGTTISVDHTFIYDTAGEGLPGDRAYELVTPPQKNGALIGAAFVGPRPDIAESGSSVTMISIQCFAEAQSCTGTRQNQGEPYLFERTPLAWGTTALAPPPQLANNTSLQTSADTGMALFSAPAAPDFEDVFYLRQPNGLFNAVGPATTPEGGAVGEPFAGGNAILASEDFTRIVYQEQPSWPAFDKSIGLVSAYEYVGVGNSAPLLVGVSGGPGSTELISLCGTELGQGNVYRSPGELSADGETIYFTADACGTAVPAKELFARIAQTHTTAISEPAAFGPAAPYPGCEHEPCIKAVNDKKDWRSASFAGASNDGSKVFFTSNQRLTDSADIEGNLYEYNFDRSEQEGHLIDISASDTSDHEPRVQGVVATSADGSHVYFVARGVLTTATNSLGRAAEDSANNLYVFERNETHPSGRVQFISRLPDTDSFNWDKNNAEGFANVTPDGRILVFESGGTLTPDATRSDSATQIYRYDASTTELTRVSIGERGFNDDGNSGQGNAKIVAAFEGFSRAGALRSNPTMSNDGSYVFFTTPIGLTPAALNDVEIGMEGAKAIYAENVYEWHDGQVGLISDGQDTTMVVGGTSSVHLYGSDGSGANVFFTTADQLLPQDTDTQRDLYDARICTSQSPCIPPAPQPPPPCLGETCHGIPAGSPPLEIGPTATLHGNGNLSGSSRPAHATPKGQPGKRCTKHKRRVHGRCVKTKAKHRIRTKHHRSRARKGGR